MFAVFYNPSSSASPPPISTPMLLGSVVLGPVVGQNQEPMAERAAHLMASRRPRASAKAWTQLTLFKTVPLVTFFVQLGPTSAVSTASL